MAALISGLFATRLVTVRFPGSSRVAFDRSDHD